MSFTFIKRLFSSSSLSAIRVVSSAYLRLLIYFLAILIPACASSNLTPAGFKQKWEETEGGKEEGARAVTQPGREGTVSKPKWVSIWSAPLWDS